MPVFGRGKINDKQRKAAAARRSDAFRTALREDWEPIEISQAWRELTAQSFAAWIRIHAFTAQALKGGRETWARVLGAPRSTVYCWLKELEEKGFIKLIPRCNKTKTGMVLTKRARIKWGTRNTWFVRV